MRSCSSLWNTIVVVMVCRGGGGGGGVILVEVESVLDLINGRHVE
jgi:hypothetical protein